MLKLILLPGMDGTGKLFESLANRLSATYEIEVVEYPTDRCLSYTELKSLVQSVIPISRSFVLLAESFSTPLAVTIAADNPSNLKGLILCTGFVSRPLLGWRRFIASYLAPILLSRPVPDSAIRAFPGRLERFTGTADSHTLCGCIRRPEGAERSPSLHPYLRRPDRLR